MKQFHEISKFFSYNPASKLLDLKIDDETTLEFHWHWEICPTCNGMGKHTNPALSVISADEWHNDWTDEERNDYANGIYDVVCTKCAGMHGKIRVIDDSITEEQAQIISELVESNDRQYEEIFCTSEYCY